VTRAGLGVHSQMFSSAFTAQVLKDNSIESPAARIARSISTTRTRMPEISRYLLSTGYE
jgi:hypothetical protein